MLNYFQTMAAVLVGRLDVKSEKGATAVEYGIMVAAIAAVIVAVVFLIGDQIVAAFETVLVALGGTLPA